MNVREIYDAKNRILRNRADMLRASRSGDIQKMFRLREENDRIRKEILKKYAVIIDY